METDVACVGAETPCGEIVRIMRERGVSSVVITSPEKRPIGILTEGDVVRRIAYVAVQSVPVEMVMTTPLHVIREDDYLFRAIALMRRGNIDHLPVITGSGEIAGVLYLRRAIATALAKIMDLVEQLTHEESFQGICRVKEAQVEVADALLNDHLSGCEVQSLLSHINQDIYRRILLLLLRDLAEEGWGEPPVPFDVIVMGSCGRGENFLYPDQDFGFIFADYPARQHNVVEAFYTGLAKRMSSMLEEVGFPLCRGNVMAQNPLWRRTLSGWIQQVDDWVERADVETLRFADIFFDFQHAAGTPSLAAALREHVTESARNNHVFLKAMQQVQQDHGVALGLRGKFETTQDDLRGELLNLKYHGLLPLVEAIRLLALRNGVVETSTRRRIQVLHAGGILNYDEQDGLNAAFETLTQLVLRQQIRDFNNGLDVGPYIAVRALSSRERGAALESLRAINELRARVRAEFTANVF